MNISISKLLSLFDESEKKSLIKLILLTIVAGISQLVAIISILPFIAVLSSPELIEKNKYFKLAQEYLNFSSQIEMLIFSGLLIITTLFVSNLFQALSVWRINKFGFEFSRLLSIRLMREYISRPYLFFVGTNSAVLMKNINTEVGRVSNGILMPVLRGVAGLVRVLFIILLLVIVNVWATLAMAAFIGLSYTFVGYMVKGRLTHNGEELSILSTQKFKVVRELFGGIKEVKLLGREEIFLEGYEITTRSMVKHEIFATVVSQLPRYFLEILTFGSLLLISMYFFLSADDSSNVLPMIGLFVIAGYRMMPAMQEVYGNFTKVKYALPALDTIKSEFTEFYNQKDHLRKKEVQTRMTIKENISLEQIVFTYPGAPKSALDGLTLEIKTNSSIGLIGASGSGKSTLVDILLGLLQAQEGQFKVDGVEIGLDNLRAWQNNIGYVPQHIYLIDDTITKNITLGTPDNEIDLGAVERASKAASLHEFILKELPLGYDNVVGESGVRLSGGQRQRIGIARALYHDPSILVLDEATSALDSVTEEAITEAITQLSGKITTIMIAHRISTLKECDVIYRLQDGKIVESGAYNTLMSSSAEFRKLAKMANEENV